MAALITSRVGKHGGLWRGGMAVCLTLISLALPASGLEKGIVLESTRLIYPGAAQNGVTFTVANHTQQTYLLQSRIFPWEAQQETAAYRRQPPPIVTPDMPEPKGAISPASQRRFASPFIILPPLVQFAPNDEMTLRIRLVENHLPRDRETLFTLALKTIPSQSADSEEPVKLVLAVQNNVKLFFRPGGLPPLTAQQRAEQLQFSCGAEGLAVRNPTPYFVTLAALHLDGHALSLKAQRMIAPFASAVYPATHCDGRYLAWQIINDEGFYTTEQGHPLG